MIKARSSTTDNVDCDKVQVAKIGRIKEFCEDKEEWSQYAERLEHFFAANGITSNDKKHSVFLTVIRQELTITSC